MSVQLSSFALPASRVILVSKSKPEHLVLAVVDKFSYLELILQPQQKTTMRNMMRTLKVAATISATIGFSSCFGGPLLTPAAVAAPGEIPIVKTPPSPPPVKDTSAWCKARTTIKASPEVVWRMVHEERQHDPDIGYTKVLEQSEHECKLEQQFKFIPVLGTSVCVTEQKEVPFERIDYKLLKSDHFKEMEGSWTFASADNGRSTVLELSSHLDLGLPVPKFMMNRISTGKLEKRLAHIKELAENVRPVASAHVEHVTR
ncbi:MAG: SRPBCC family protein [Candidatus Obscuribacterales bacterium]|nr:SRPBCC family protein [Candidatus Obscuribacterales bacterium]